MVSENAQAPGEPGDIVGYSQQPQTDPIPHLVAYDRHTVLYISVDRKSLSPVIV